MSKKKGSKKREQQKVNTVVPKKQEAKVPETKEKEVFFEQVRTRLRIGIGAVCVILILVGFVLIIHDRYQNYKNQKASEAAVIQHTKEEIYGTYLDSQYQMIAELKEYKNTQLQQWKDGYEYEEGFHKLYITTKYGDEFIISSLKVDNLIQEHANEIKLETQYEKIIPEFSYWHELFDPWEKKFPDHLSDLENLVLEFPKSYGINSSIKSEIEGKKSTIEEGIKDEAILKRVWTLEKKCSKNLENIEKLLEIEE